MKISIEEAKKISQEKIQDKSSKGKTTDQILQKGLKVYAKMLDSHPDYYRAFGPYWWIMKKLFAKYLKSDNWYCTGVYNAIDTTRYGFDDEWLEYCAAIYYFSQNSFDRPSLHIMRDGDDGEEVSYTIYDEDAPC